MKMAALDDGEDILINKLTELEKNYVEKKDKSINKIVRYSDEAFELKDLTHTITNITDVISYKIKHFLNILLRNQYLVLLILILSKLNINLTIISELIISLIVIIKHFGKEDANDVKKYIEYKLMKISEDDIKELKKENYNRLKEISIEKRNEKEKIKQYQFFIDLIHDFMDEITEKQNINTQLLIDLDVLLKDIDEKQKIKYLKNKMKTQTNI